VAQRDPRADDGRHLAGAAQIAERRVDAHRLGRTVERARHVVGHDLEHVALATRVERLVERRQLDPRPAPGARQREVERAPPRDVARAPLDDPARGEARRADGTRDGGGRRTAQRIAEELRGRARVGELRPAELRVQRDERCAQGARAPPRRPTGALDRRQRLQPRPGRSERADGPVDRVDGARPRGAAVTRERCQERIGRRDPRQRPREGQARLEPRRQDDVRRERLEQAEAEARSRLRGVTRQRHPLHVTLAGDDVARGRAGHREAPETADAPDPFAVAPPVARARARVTRDGMASTSSIACGAYRKA
jgi:hypothetical protein